LNRTTVKIRAIYADTDAMGIVYHTNYIRWFEVGRTELFRDIGIPYTEVEAAGFNLPLTQVYCHYLLPTHYDDLVLIETKIAYLKRASMKFSYLIWDETG
jgi:acyl-CoA thioester hydrolase